MLPFIILGLLLIVGIIGYSYYSSQNSNKSTSSTSTPTTTTASTTTSPTPPENTPQSNTSTPPVPILKSIISEAGPDYVIVKRDDSVTGSQNIIPFYDNSNYKYSITYTDQNGNSNSIDIPNFSNGIRITGLSAANTYNYTLFLKTIDNTTVTTSTGVFSPMVVSPDFEMSLNNLVRNIITPQTENELGKSSLKATISITQPKGGSSNISSINLTILKDGTSMDSRNVTLSSFPMIIDNMEDNKIYKVTITVTNPKGDKVSKFIDINTNKQVFPTGSVSFSVAEVPFINVKFPNISKFISSSGTSTTKSYLFTFRNKDGSVFTSYAYTFPSSQDIIDWKSNYSSLSAGKYDLFLSSYDINEVLLGEVDTTVISSYSYIWKETDCDCNMVQSQYTAQYTNTSIGNYQCVQGTNEVSNTICDNIRTSKPMKPDSCITNKCVKVAGDVVLSGGDINAVISQYGNSQFPVYTISSSGFSKLESLAGKRDRWWIKSIEFTSPVDVTGKPTQFTYELTYQDGTYTTDSSTGVVPVDTSKSYINQYSGLRIVTYTQNTILPCKLTIDTTI